MTAKKLLHKINSRWTKLRLQPIRVFCFHQVSETFDPNVNCKSDWISLTQFRQSLLLLKQMGYKFISLSSAYEHLRHDLFRFKKYAVLTGDDGLLSQYEQIKWLEANQIPITLFLNLNFVQDNTLPTHYQEYYRNKSSLTETQLSSQLYIKVKDLENLHSDYVTIALHSLKHENMAQKTKKEICDDIMQGENFFMGRKDFIKFYCYPFGCHSSESDAIVQSCGYVPVLIDGQQNYNDASCIHREILK